jgi:hypothetical protein
MWRPDEGCHAGTPSLSTAGFLLLPAFDATIHLQPASTMIGRMTGAFGADDVVSLGPQFRKLRFQMIADIRSGSRANTADSWANKKTAG